MTIQEAISRVVSGENLSGAEAEAVMNSIMEGEATPAQIAGLLVGLRMKGETPEEVTAFARVMRRKATKIETRRENLVDTCGTGGDGTHTFNISTAAAFVVAGAEVPVAKHGNRSVSSRCGSADVLKEMGVNIEAPVETVARCIDEIGIGFLYAPMLHKAMKHAIGPRRELGIRTVFNILGPLTNPAGATSQVLGVFSPHLTVLMAQTLANLGSRRAFVVHGDGMDEISLCGKTVVAEVNEGRIQSYLISPEDFGMQRTGMDEFVVSSPRESAEMILGVLRGERGPRRDIVLLNAAAGIMAGGKAESFNEAISFAEEAIDSGRALEKLTRLVELTNEELEGEV
jgi:anthranilate phosphoribosyltransferase